MSWTTFSTTIQLFNKAVPSRTGFCNQRGCRCSFSLIFPPLRAGLLCTCCLNCSRFWPARCYRLIHCQIWRVRIPCIVLCPDNEAILYHVFHRHSPRTISGFPMCINMGFRWRMLSISFAIFWKSPDAVSCPFNNYFIILYLFILSINHCLCCFPVRLSAPFMLCSFCEFSA